MNKGKKIKQSSNNPINPWDNVKVVRGKLTGGVLTDKLIGALHPVNYVKFSRSGLDIVHIKSVSGSKTPSRPR